MRTFAFRPEAEPPKIYREPKKPTRVEVMKDREMRSKTRTEARKFLLSTGSLQDERAVEMAVGGFGIEDIHTATGIERSVIRRLVLGE